MRDMFKLTGSKMKALTAALMLTLAAAEIKNRRRKRRRNLT